MFWWAVKLFRTEAGFSEFQVTGIRKLSTEISFLSKQAVLDFAPSVKSLVI